MKRFIYVLLFCCAAFACTTPDPIEPCDTYGGDADKDGYCVLEDCDDNDASVFPGAPCDDRIGYTVDDSYDDNCECVGFVSIFVDERNGMSYRMIPFGNGMLSIDLLNIEAPGAYYFGPMLDRAAGLTYYQPKNANQALAPGMRLPTIEELLSSQEIFGSLKGMGEDTYWNEFTTNVGASPSSVFFARGAGYAQYDRLGYFPSPEQSLLGAAAIFLSSTHNEGNASLMRLDIDKTEPSVVAVLVNTPTHYDHAFPIRFIIEDPADSRLERIRFYDE